jgi:cysteinyl-tRNA synthetase
MTDFHFHNTASGKKERFTPIDPEHIKIYVCGPTVYSFVHIGNGRPAVIFDVLVRLLRLIYPRVTYVRNVTDIDDKINNAALENNESIQTLADRYTQAYEEDMIALGVVPPDIAPRATHHISEITSMITRLIEKDFAYEKGGHVLFHVPSDPDYGGLSRRTLDEMVDGARVDIAPYKKDAKDFVLWKPSNLDQPGWDSPWGNGRPGWHIECSAMIHKHLGETIDIHGGGSDLTFPHHENEAAQSRCANGSTDYVRYWLHNGMLNLGAEKMSKSLGNIKTVRDLCMRHSGEVLRYALLSGQYRSQLSWSDDVVAQAKSSLDSLYQALRDNPGTETIAPDEISNLAFEDYPNDVVEPLLDDLNSPMALASMHDLAANLQKAVTPKDIYGTKQALLAGGRLLGLLGQNPDAYFKRKSENSNLSSNEIEQLITERTTARADKNFERADEIRQELSDLGIELEDLRGETRWRRT